MKQRVALALALALRPKFVLLDEPTTGLDVVVQRDILDRLAELRVELGFAVLFISHDLGTVMEMADRVMVMYGGEIVEDQPAADIVTAHHHPYTAGLLGSYADPRDEVVEVAFIPGRPPDLSRDARRLPVRAALPDRRSTPAAPITPSSLPAGRGSARCLLVEAEAAGGPTAGSRGAASSSWTRSSPRTRSARGGADDEPGAGGRRRQQGLPGPPEPHHDDHRGGGRRVVRAAPRTGQRAGRPERLAARRRSPGWSRASSGPPAAGSGSRTPRSTSWAGEPCARYRRHVQLVFQDPFSRAQPDPHHRLRASAVRCATTWAWTRSRPAQRARRAAGDGRDEPARPVPRQAAAPALRWSAPAGRDRPGAGAGAGGPDRRRADLDARRVDPGGDRRPARPARARPADRDALHHPRPAQRAAARRRGDGAEPGHRGRARPDARGDPVGEGPLHEDAAGGHLAAGLTQPGGARSREPSVPVDGPAAGEELATPTG